jgi:transcriptional regulator with XRE-family HTH domain
LQYFEIANTKKCVILRPQINKSMIKQTNKVKTGNKIRALRIAHNFSTSYVADMLNISESTYRKYETDKSSPNVNMLNEIAKVYDIEIVDLLPDSYIHRKSKGNSAVTNEKIINYFSDKIIQLYENRISDLKEQVHELKKQN